ncbi:MAG: hypothetical protein WA102_04280 [Candidatus Methanoperedens sp.]
MKLAEFIEALEKAASKYSSRLRILAKTENAVKARIEISENIYVQFYFHQESGTTNYVLVDGRTDYMAGTAWEEIGINIHLIIPKLMIERAMALIM